MKLIVGLGNPGVKYQMTRHNLGFMAVDSFVNHIQAGSLKSDHQSLVLKTSWKGYPLLLAKPQTFMNLSGQALLSLISYYQIDPKENLLVIHDEVDLSFGELKYQTHRGHGGHNGVRNIHQLLGTNQYQRLRLGVGRPEKLEVEVANHVLQNFNSQEIKELPFFLGKVVESLECFITQGFQKTATAFNGKD